MSRELKVIIDGISNLETKTKVIENDKESVLVTVVRFQCETPAGRFDGVHEALRCSQPVTVMLACPQLAMELGDKTDPRD